MAPPRAPGEPSPAAAAAVAPPGALCAKAGCKEHRRPSAANSARPILISDRRISIGGTGRSDERAYSRILPRSSRNALNLFHFGQGVARTQRAVLRNSAPVRGSDHRPSREWSETADIRESLYQSLLNKNIRSG